MKKFFTYLILYLIFAQGTCCCYEKNSLPEPYRSLKIIPLDLHGWFGGINKIKIDELIQKYQPKVVVELGSWLGKSAVHIAQAIPDDGILYAVDHWQGVPNIQNNPSLAPKIKNLYQRFLSNIIQSGVAHKVVPVRMSTQEAAQALDIKIDLIYIDAGHDEESVYNDIINWWPKVKVGGIMCGDDWSWPGVPKAVKKAADQLNIGFHVAKNQFWHFDAKKYKG